MAWLIPRSIAPEAHVAFDAFFTALDEQLSDPKTDRNVLCRNLLAELLYGRTYDDLLGSAPVVALNLDPRNITLEAEYYAVTDVERFAQVKPLLWLWYNADLSPSAQSVEFGVRLRRMLALYVFKRVGRNFKCFSGVQFSVGYNLEVGDDVVIHSGVLVDDIGGVTLHDGVSLSDGVHIYSHTHSALESEDVTLRHTTLGRGVRVTYHATVLAGTTLSDDSMVGALALVRGDVNPSEIAVGIPAQAKRRKNRSRMSQSTAVDARTYTRPADRKANPDYPEATESAEETHRLEPLRL